MFVLLAFIISAGFAFLYSLIGSIILIISLPSHTAYDISGATGLSVVFYFLITIFFNFLTFFVGTLVEKKNNPAASFFPDKKIFIFLTFGNLIVAFLPAIL